MADNYMDLEDQVISSLDIQREELMEYHPGLPIYMQQPTEPDIWYVRFYRTFLLQGHNRTLVNCRRIEWQALKKAKRATTDQDTYAKKFNPLWKKAVKVFRWHQRAAVWDQHQVAIDYMKWRNERDKLIAESFKDRKEVVKICKTAIAQVSEMLQADLYEAKMVKVGDNKKELVAVPAGWSKDTAARLLNAAISARASADRMISDLIPPLDDTGQAIETLVRAGMLPDYVLQTYIEQVEQAKNNVMLALAGDDHQQQLNFYQDAVLDLVNDDRPDHIAFFDFSTEDLE